jgi:1-acyl-sn-glycerol-3-phosphate acyltransferase
VTRRPRAPSPVARRSPTVWRFMAAYFARYFRRHMGSLRLARWGRPDGLVPGRPVVIVMNHPGWWDGALVVLLGAKLFPARETYCPIESAMLAKYGVFGRMGAFGVDLDRASGAADFLRVSAEILARPNAAYWITAEGRFRDVRDRPLTLKPGAGRLAEIAPGAVFLPLAVEYAFWDERGAEACIAFGAPIPGEALAALPRPERLAHLESALTDTLDRLALDVRARDPAAFTTLLHGRAGIGGVYDGWRRLTAALRGERFDPSHGGA